MSTSEQNGATASKRVLMVVANPSVSTTLGYPVGFWASELTHPYLEFREAGYEVTIASPKGGRVEFDAMSDPRDESGYSRADLISLGFIHTPELMALLERTPSLDEVDVAEYDAIVVCGGQSPMFTFRDERRLHALIREFHDAGKPTAALCHGVAALLHLRDANGRPLIASRRITGFANAEEHIVDGYMGTKVMPFRIEDEARALGADFVTAEPFRPFAVRDGNLITGQQQNSGRKTAELVIAALAG
jgi:putative intracellular protease/amidase